MSVAFVTGGSGFVGRTLIRRLAADGWTVRALARSPASAKTVQEAGAEPVDGDLSDPAVLAAGAEGADVFFHNAAKVEVWGPWEEFDRATVQGTQNALAACAQAGVSRFVHTSSEAACVDGNPLVNADETWPLKPDARSPYPRAKARAEQAVVAANGQNGVTTVMVRPRFVWGADDTTLLPQIVELMRAGKFAWIGGGRQLTSTTHVSNTVEGLMCAAERGNGGEAYYVTDGPPLEFRTMVTELVATQGVEAPTRNLPKGLLLPLANACEGLWSLLKLKSEPPLPRLGIWNAALEFTLDDSKARREIGYEPVISREDGLAELAATATANS